MPKKPSINPQDFQPGPVQIEAFVRKAVETVKGARSVEDRRNWVLLLDGMGLKRAEIYRLVEPLFKISLKTMDDDLKITRDYWTNWMSGRTRHDALLQVEKTNMTVIRQGFAHGDLAAVNQANRLMASIWQIVKEGAGARIEVQSGAELGGPMKVQIYLPDNGRGDSGKDV